MVCANADIGRKKSARMGKAQHGSFYLKSLESKRKCNTYLNHTLFLEKVRPLTLAIMHKMHMLFSWHKLFRGTTIGETNKI